LRVLPIWELSFTKLPDEAPRIATEKVKWDRRYQRKIGVKTALARDLPEPLVHHIKRLCRRVYRVLEISGYARLDFRLTADGQVYVLEANPNPQLAEGEDFADSAAQAGLSYPALLQRIINLALQGRMLPS
jgi:D-alanine-D-alanine ligase